ncbi:GGDEF domain-containing protein [Aliamphritea ceti]|uniref:GGDEF domain-containing protein n=1 Tax=Aliamphritea ceti TaxID=1524258 RepID=UPI0021C45F0A|nr:GGDEF domain-containing protein [Aliamphritea ceti]
MADYIVYGDLNCPFSYALHELLSSHNLLSQVEWRLVEHTANISSYASATESMSETASDIFDIRNRIPDISITLPPNRSDSYFPSLCVIAIEQMKPNGVSCFRQALYRNLWIEGKDIADTPVIFNALESCNLTTEIEANEACEAILQDWQAQWEAGNFGLRTPAILSSDGRRMVGLQNYQNIIEFFQGQTVESPDHQPTSQHKERQTIAVYGQEACNKLWNVLSMLRDNYNLLLPQSWPALKEQLISTDHCPDLVLIHQPVEDNNLAERCLELNHYLREKQIPLACIGPELDDTLEASLYDAGTADYLLEHRNPAIIQARIGILLQLKRSHDLLARAASIDNLTQVYNRREFERTLEMEWRRSQRSKQSLSLILLDIDYFKAYNDHYGHLNGDNCLRQVAKAIKDSARRVQDIVSRYGGEEFCILLPETDLAGAQKLAENIRDNINRLAIPHTGDLADKVTASLGISTLLPANGSSPRALIEQADQALYKAKSAGRNQVMVFNQRR